MRIQNVVCRRHASEGNAKPVEFAREGRVAKEVISDIVPLEALSSIVGLDSPGNEDRPKDAVQKELGLSTTRRPTAWQSQPCSGAFGIMSFVSFGLRGCSFVGPKTLAFNLIPCADAEPRPAF